MPHVCIGEERPVSNTEKGTGTRQRSALRYGLCIGTGQRIRDALKIRRGHIKFGAYDFTRGKTDTPSGIRLTDRIKTHVGAVEKRRLTVITDKSGRPVRYRTGAEEMHKIKATMQHPEAAK